MVTNTNFDFLSPTWSTNDLIYALENAANFLETEEWPEEDDGVQVGANREAARRIRRVVDRLLRKTFGGNREKYSI